MIVTLTPNPAIDRTLAIPALVRGGMHRAAAPVVEASGKGVNVAKALLVNGHAAVAVLPADGPLTGLLRAAGVPCEVAEIEGPVRTNVSLLEPDGTVTKVNEPGPTVSKEDCRRLLAMTLDELSELVGPRPQTLADVVEAAQELRAFGARAVLVSLGADGAVLVDDEGARHGEVVVDRPRNTVGAGDALLAGFLAGGLSEALAYAAAAARHVGTHAPAVTAEDRAAVRLHPEINSRRQVA